MREWFLAARDGDDERVAELLARQPALIDLKDTFQGTALHLATQGGHEKVVARLLAACPALLQETTSLDCTALDIAATKGDDKMVAQLLALADSTHYPGSLTIGLYNAVTKGREKVVDLLLSAKRPGLVSANRHANRTLFYVAEKGHERVFTQLLAACPELIDELDDSGTTVLHHTASRGHDRMVAQILSLRPKLISAVDYCGWNALMYAVDGGHQTVAERLLALEPELISQVTHHGDTVLHRAVARSANSPQFVGWLWRMNPRALKRADAELRTPFYFAVSFQRDELIELFQWSLSLDKIGRVFAQNRANFQERYKPLMEQLCEPLFGWLGRDVINTVLEFLALGGKRTELASEN